MRENTKNIREMGNTKYYYYFEKINVKIDDNIIIFNLKKIKSFKGNH